MSNRPGRKAKETIKQTADQWLARNRSLVLRQTPVWAQSMAGIIIGLGLTSIVAGVIFRIDEVVTVTGQLEALTGSVDVKTPTGGKVASTFFEDGELIKKGEPLIQFDTRQAKSDRATNLKLIELERMDLKARLQTLEESKKVLKKKLRTSEEITQSLNELVANGAYQKVQYLQQLDQQYELESLLSSTELEIVRTKFEAEKLIGQLESELKQAELQLQYQNIMAPATGVVFEPKASVDGVLRAGDTVLTIIPQQGLKAKVFVANKDIGFVKSGQKAQVRVDAFPFTRYGDLEGEISQIGADALPPDQTADYYRFPVKLKLNKFFLENKGVRVPLRSGMSVTANLKLRDKRLISLLSDMLVDQTDSIRGIRQQ